MPSRERRYCPYCFNTGVRYYPVGGDRLVRRDCTCGIRPKEQRDGDS